MRKPSGYLRVRRPVVQSSTQCRIVHGKPGLPRLGRVYLTPCIVSFDQTSFGRSSNNTTYVPPSRRTMEMMRYEICDIEIDGPHSHHETNQKDNYKTPNSCVASDGLTVFDFDECDL
ncbi:hypothetical protein RJT34_01534 [Clitoria ternatea]|uniref:Uncharacterized protein n=1 Tax=Clitoria ternatea TaxID=43366 RepID=A0AAN9Q0K0_CLITE